MYSILIKIIPLDFAATLSPGILALAILLLGNKNKPFIKTLSLTLGILIVGILISVLGFYLGVALPTGVKENSLSAVVDILLGIFFIIFGIKVILEKEKKRHLQSSDNAQILKWIIVGVLVSITNFDAVFFIFTAAKEVGGAAINNFTKIILLVVNNLFFILPVTFPVLFYLLFPRISQRVLEKLNSFLMRFGKYIVFALFMIFGIIFLVRGLKYF
jgi:threonine/homoserine/homoserine lactone efflux protein